jgi:hypothetical protein
VSVENWDQEFLNYWNAFDMGTGGSQLVARASRRNSRNPRNYRDWYSSSRRNGGNQYACSRWSNEQIPDAVAGLYGTPTWVVMTVSEMQGMILAEDLLGFNLVSCNGDPLGEVEDAILDLETVLFATFDLSGRQPGYRRNWVPVPIEALGRR